MLLYEFDEMTEVFLVTEQGQSMNQNPEVAGFPPDLIITLLVSHPLGVNIHRNVSRAKDFDRFILATILRFLKEQTPILS